MKGGKGRRCRVGWRQIKTKKHREQRKKTGGIVESQREYL